MDRIEKSRRFLSGLGHLLFTLAILVAPMAPVSATNHDEHRTLYNHAFNVFNRIAPIHSKPGGQTYGRWGAEWFKWAFGIPFPTNPNVDATGENCAARQVDDTWFLAQTNPFSGQPVVRECTIPKGRSLLIPLLNSFFGAELTLPPEERTEEFAREAASCTEPLKGFAEIDGVRIGERFLNRFSTGPSGSESPIFTVQLPPDNIFGLDEFDAPELVLTPAAQDGYYLYVKPLSLGEHTISWNVSGCQPGRTQDITYYLTILDTH